MDNESYSWLTNMREYDYIIQNEGQNVNIVNLQIIVIKLNENFKKIAQSSYRSPSLGQIKGNCL